MASTPPNPKLPALLRLIINDQGLLTELDAYYEGRQQIQFIAPEIRRALGDRLQTLIINWCGLVVDSIEERLDVDGFRLAGGQKADENLWRIWQANDMDEKSQLAHVDGMVHGRAFAIVWENEDDPATPKITVESAEQMIVEFEPGTSKVIAAAKRWNLNNVAYSTLYLPNSIERYQAQIGVGGRIVSGWSLRADPIPNLYGVVPVVPLINRPRTTQPYGRSELANVIPLVNGICKLATDMMVTAEYHADPRRWATGIDMGGEDMPDDRAREIIKQRWTDAATGRVWTSDSKDAKFGQFDQADLDNFVRGIEMLAAQLAGIAGLPPHYVGLMSQANPASADAIRSAEASLVRKVERKMRVFGGAWERVMRLALLIQNRGTMPANAAAMETIWKDPKTPSIGQQVDAAVKLHGIGMPFRQTLEDLGYTPTAASRAIELRTSDAMTNAEALLGKVDTLVGTYGISRAAALALLGEDAAAKAESLVESRQPGPGVVNDEQLAAYTAAATPPAVPAA